MKPNLRLIHAVRVACWPWGLAWLQGSGDVQYATCRDCKRDVAQPVDRAREVPVCIYCALDSGVLPHQDEPLA